MGIACWRKFRVWQVRPRAAKKNRNTPYPVIFLEPLSGSFFILYKYVRDNVRNCPLPNLLYNFHCRIITIGDLEPALFEYGNHWSVIGRRLRVNTF